MSLSSHPSIRQRSPVARGDAVCSQPTVLFRYASGAVLKLVDGPHGGALFIGDQGRITIDRGHAAVDPPELAQAPLGTSRRSPGRQRRPHAELDRLHQVA